MMPARRAAWSGSPFANAPCLISRSAVALIVISPRAVASRAVTALSPTSTIRALPFASRCESTGAGVEPAVRTLLATLLISLSKVEGEAFKGDSQIDALELDIRWNFKRSGRKVEDGLDA